MYTINTTDQEFYRLIRLQKHRRNDWPAIFSCNSTDAPWPFVTFGHTPAARRQNIFGQSRLLDEIVKTVLSVRKEGGRIFINNRGVYMKPSRNHILIAKLRIKKTTTKPNPFRWLLRHRKQNRHKP